jgi:anaerobic ribonucleoside-triphosphate reductase activating protein
MRITLNKAHFPVTVLGPGRRIGIWFQGCSIGCAGCVSRDTWLSDQGRSIDVAQLLEWCKAKGSDGVDGVTISGGEPFEQPDGLVEFLRGLHAWRAEMERPVDILCYSGFRYSRLQRDHGEILTLLDALIPEPFQHRRPQERLWRGSANQPLIILSALGEQRFGPFLEAGGDAGARVQVEIGEKGVWYVGIPQRGDMERLEKAVRARGLIIGDVSWRV